MTEQFELIRKRADMEVQLFNIENRLGEENNPIYASPVGDLYSQADTERRERDKLDRKRPYKDKRLRKLLIIVYLYIRGPSTENKIREHALKGGNHREIHKDLEELAKKGVCTKIPLGSGYVVLTKYGKEIALSIFDSKEVKLILEFLDLHTMIFISPDS